MARLSGRVAVITGAARGIGRAIAEAMAAEGASVVVTDRDEGELADVKKAIESKGGKCWTQRLDVTDVSAINKLADWAKQTAGTVSIVVNNAGMIFPERIHESDAAAHWSKTLQINVDGGFHMARAFYAQLKATKGAMINLASIRSFSAAPNAAAYATSKGAVMQFTKAMAVEWGPEGIRVNAIAPGFIDTAFVPQAEKTQAREDWIIARTPLKRQGTPEEVAGAAVFLASEDARYITGAILPVDGGYLAA
jgi:meso-butanediol dehydrogenase / (S,S)-butanediol dehydrogenase / diacetyl reductase